MNGIKIGLNIWHGGDQVTVVVVTVNFEGGGCQCRPSLIGVKVGGGRREVFGFFIYFR